MNIVSMMMQFLAPALVKRIAGSLGIPEGIAQKVISVALPVILSGIIGKASQPAGARALTDVLAKQDTGLLGSLGDLIGSPKQASLAEQGLSTLGSLLGGGALNSLTGALSKFGGTNETATKGLLGLLGPVVLGGLAQQQKSAGLDGAGLVNMLMGQKQNVAAAIPSDFAKMLGGTGLLDAVASHVAPAARPAEAQPAPRPTAAPAVTAPRSAMAWLPWAIGALAALFLLWWFVLGGNRPQIAELPAAPRITLDNVDVGGRLGSALSGLRQDLIGIRDVAGARAALPRIERVAGELQQIQGLAGRLPAAGRKSLADFAAASLPAITPLIANAVKIPGAEAVIKPALDQVAARLQAIARP